MDYSAFMERQAAKWAEAKASLSKIELSLIAGKKGWQNRRLEMFTARYYRREKLIRNSQVYLGYAFKDYREGNDKAAAFPVWVLWSPDRYYEEHPEEYESVLSRLRDAIPLKKQGLRGAKINAAMKENFADAFALALPSEVTNGRPVYLYIMYCHASAVPNFHLGLHIFLANLGVSKEILFLPSLFWDQEFLEEYAGKKEEAIPLS